MIAIITTDMNTTGISRYGRDDIHKIFGLDAHTPQHGDNHYQPPVAQRNHHRQPRILSAPVHYGSVLEGQDRLEPADLLHRPPPTAGREAAVPSGCGRRPGGSSSTVRAGSCRRRPAGCDLLQERRISPHSGDDDEHGAAWRSGFATPRGPLSSHSPMLVVLSRDVIDSWFEGLPG